MTIHFVTTGTVAVENGSKAIVGTGTGWLAESVKQGDTMMVQGIQVWVDTLDEETQTIQAAQPYSGATGSGLAYAIMPTSPEWVRNMTINQHLAQQILAQQAIGGAMMVAVTDELYPFSTSTAAITFRAPQAMHLDDIAASLKTASSSGPIEVDVKVNGTSLFSTTLTVDEGERTSLTAAVPAEISTPDIEADDEITVAIVQAGTGAVGLKLNFIAAQP